MMHRPTHTTSMAPFPSYIISIGISISIIAKPVPHPSTTIPHPAAPNTTNPF